MFASLVLIAAASSVASYDCTLLYPVAPDAAAVGRIADAAIASHPPGALRSLFSEVESASSYDPSAPKRYTLSVELAEGEDRWIVDVYPAEFTADDGKVISAFSPVLAMQIDRCTGAVLAFDIAF